MHYGIFGLINGQEALLGTRDTAWDAHKRAQELQDKGTPCYVDIIVTSVMVDPVEVGIGIPMTVR